LPPTELHDIHAVVSQRGGMTLIDEIYLGLSHDAAYEHSALGWTRRSSASTVSASTST
jgi:aspartate/methionine/tyrosine aminotransferase